MKRIYHPYTKWEDFHNGMYNLNLENSEEMIYLAKTLLCDCGEFYKTMKELIDRWPFATEVNLTNIDCNRRAWLGQAACCYKYRVPETLTRVAWKYMSEDDRNNANKIAERCIIEYEDTLKNGKKDAIQTAYQMKFQLG